ncbi:MAG TPA: hypothetical protein VMU25_02420 [Candidatus Paceibacterota bacterium]|nr:hypothetical protein [Candidatus Paceibacterota bacterium]
MYKPRFTEFTSSDDYKALGEKVGQRHPHFVILVPPGGKPVAIKFKDNWDSLPWCDLFWDKHKYGIICVPDYDDVEVPDHLEPPDRILDL